MIVGPETQAGQLFPLVHAVQRAHAGRLQDFATHTQSTLAVDSFHGITCGLFSWHILTAARMVNVHNAGRMPICLDAHMP
jgi:hypothetical protein